MNTPLKLAGFGLGLGALLGAGLLAGQAAGPSERGGSHVDDSPDGEAHGAPSHHPGPAAEGDVAGLRVSQGGFTLVPETSELDVAQPAPFRFRIMGPDGAPLRSYRVEHDRELHLIVASRDLTWFSHVHPTRDPGGTWSVPLQAPRPGPYRAFADFAPTTGDKLVLGVDLSAAGEFRPLPLPAPQARSAVDGYDVFLDSAPRAAGLTTVTMSVQRGGRPVTDLQPYLGAYGHLVALRAGDLAYLHVHPEGEPGDGRTRPGPDVRFGVELPSAGNYRLFFDFQHEGTVRTADFTVSVPPAPTGAAR